MKIELGSPLTRRSISADVTVVDSGWIVCFGNCTAGLGTLPDPEHVTDGYVPVALAGVLKFSRVDFRLVVSGLLDMTMLENGVGPLVDFFAARLANEETADHAAISLVRPGTICWWSGEEYESGGA